MGFLSVFAAAQNKKNGGQPHRFFVF